MERHVCASLTSSLTQSRRSRLLNPGRRLLPATGHVTAAPNVASLSVLSGTLTTVPPGSTKKSNTREPSAQSATLALALA